MNKLEKEIRTLESLDNNSNIETRISMIKNINQLIDKELKNLNSKFENLEDKGKVFAKYKKHSLDELGELFDSNSLDEQIKIFQTFSQKIDDNINELFNQDETEEMSSDESDESNSS